MSIDWVKSQLNEKEYALSVIEDAVRTGVLSEGKDGGVMVYKEYELSEGWEEISKEEAAQDLVEQDAVETLFAAVEKANAFIKKNANKDVLKFNGAQHLYAEAYRDFIELKSIVDSHNGSFEELCEKLDGDQHDDNIYKVDYGVVDAFLSYNHGEILLNDALIDIWDESHNKYLEDSVSFKRLKETCEEIGFDVSLLEAHALERGKTRRLSLDEQIAGGAARAPGVKDSSVNKDIER